MRVKKGGVKRVPKNFNWPPISKAIKKKFDEKGGVYAVAMRKKVLGNNIYKRMSTADKSIQKINELLHLVDCSLEYQITPFVPFIRKTLEKDSKI